jgi:hypothetical protein
VGASGRGSRPATESQTLFLPEVVWNDAPETVRVRSGNRGGLWLEFPSTPGHEKPWGNLGGPPPKAKYFWPPIANQYREGKVKRTPQGE